MTLEEAINRFEKLASDYEFNLNMHKNHVVNLSVNDIERMQGYFEEHRQLAEWLRELKESRMVLDILGQFLVDIDIDICCEDLAMTDDYCEKYCDNKKPLCWYRWAKAKANEVNADE